LIANNENAKGEKVRGAIKRGVALLSGLLRCGHCGAKLHASYPRPDVVRYTCVRHVLNSGTSCRLMFGGARADQLVADQVLKTIQPTGLKAAMQAIDNLRYTQDERVKHVELALTQAQYEVTRAQRQYDAVDALCDPGKNVALSPGDKARPYPRVIRAPHYLPPIDLEGMSSGLCLPATDAGAESPLFRNARAPLPWSPDRFLRRCWSCRQKRAPTTPEWY